ncbi:MAG: efflux RND transporter periplasmic adaptor subunit [Phycisphaerales bacterium]|nr:MAG: efflux RND transporter periplasmic adaptor subunit [Phycisphaerales bacterium]
MSNSGSDNRAGEVKGVLIRWSIVLAVLAALAAWSTWRMQQVASRLSDVSPRAATSTTSDDEIEYWTCSMHPAVRQPEPGDCPQCGMELIPKYVGSDEPGIKRPEARPFQAGATDKTKSKRWYMCTMPECGDRGSDDPDSRCPVCGMKREPVMMDMSSQAGEAEIALGEHARRLAELATEPVTRRHLTKRIRTVGKVTYDETHLKMVSAWTSGRIDRLFADFTGMVVSSGDHLVEIYSPELISAQEELLQATRSLDAARIDSTGSSRPLSEALVVSARRKLELLGVNAAQIEELKRTGEVANHLVIHTPLDGTIIHKWAMEGKYVKTGDPLYQIADLTKVWLLLDLYEADLPWIAPFQEVSVMTQSLPGETFRGEIVFVDPVVDPATRTIKVRVNVNNPDRRLKPEMYVKAQIDVAVGAGGHAATPAARGAFVCPMHTWETAEASSVCPICKMDMIAVEKLPGYRPPDAPLAVLSVPAEAVMRTGRRALVYVETNPGVYRGVEVKIAAAAQDETGRRFYPVSEGIHEGQNVVTRGNFVIDSQMQLAGKPSLFNARGLAPAAMHDYGVHSGGAAIGKGREADD